GSRRAAVRPLSEPVVSPQRGGPVVSPHRGGPVVSPQLRPNDTSSGQEHVTRPQLHDSDQPAAPRDSDQPTGRAFERVLALLADRPLVVLTGAGLSTDSGISDYRGPLAPARRPMTYDEFVSGPQAQRRYWARSHVGWRRMHEAAPNAGHRALAALEAHGQVDLLITQNVDGLHEAAGSNPLALHGRISDVVCLTCRQVTSRDVLHARLDELNP